MTFALLYGAGSGAVHAVTGPDHLLSLGPQALEERKAPFGVGLRWGAGHALGTLVLGLPVLLLVSLVHWPGLSAFSDRLAGVALLGLSLWSFRSLRRAAQQGGAARRQRPVLVGFVHGLTGAASLLMMAPVASAGSLPLTVAFLVAFAVGSTLAMGALTYVVARVGSRLERSVLPRAQKVLLCGAAAVGVWLAFG